MNASRTVPLLSQTTPTFMGFLSMSSISENDQASDSINEKSSVTTSVVVANAMSKLRVAPAV
jgi:hypothetical protein